MGISFHSHIMSRISLALITLSTGLFALTPVVLAQDYETPRIANGRPDLQDLWTNDTITPIERPIEIADNTFLTTLYSLLLGIKAVDVL